MKPKKFYFLNLGCPKNQVDGDYLRGTLEKHNFHETNMAQEADYLIVNTCAFVKEARQESLAEIRALVPLKKKDSRLVVVGCYPVIAEIKNEVPQVDAAFRFDEQAKFLRYVLNGKGKEAGDAVTLCRALPAAGYAYVKIADGCDNWCSYCNIPRIRGRYRSRPAAEVLLEVRRLAMAGVREVILVAQDSALYGCDLKERVNLTSLCRRIAEIDEIAWIRVMYLHPAHINNRMICELLEIEKVCRYLDIPIQHISQKILDRMNRKTRADELRKLIRALRHHDREISLRTSLIVGFPGEGDDDFKLLLDFVEEVEFDHVGAFCYSAEDETLAAAMSDQVEPSLAAERYEMLMETAESVRQKRQRLEVGKRRRLLIDSYSASETNWVEARSFRQAPEVDGYYCLKADDRLRPGRLVEATIVGLDEAVLE